MNLFFTLCWYLFHVVIPIWLGIEILKERDRAKHPRLGYLKETAQKNVWQMTVALAVYLALLGIYHWHQANLPSPPYP